MQPVRADEVRVLEGPNLYFTRPAVKISLALPGYLDLDAHAALDVARRAGLRAARPGRSGTAQRQRFVMRLLAHLVRRVAAEAGVRRLAVHTRAGRAADEVVVAVPWRRRGRAVALGEGMPPLLTALLAPDADADALVANLGRMVAAAEPGRPAAVVTPAVPVVTITGTNGKTTTTRMVAHLSMTAGLRTAWSSTDGVVVMGELVHPGDYSGPAGGREVLATEGLQMGILETARGGMLLKGMGVSRSDVTVVTNVAADHLGLHGVDTLDQLAEVKAIPTRIVTPDGWVVLNGDDPRVWAMRHRCTGKVWAVSLDPNSPALRESLETGGRGITVLDGEIVVLAPGRDPDRLVKVVDVPMTLAGLSRINVANVLGAAAAGLAVGLPRDAVVNGLKDFRPDPVLNGGRFNTYSVPLAAGGAATVVVDMAHNEAGLDALLEVCRGLAGSGGRVLLGLGGTGDRTDEAIEGLGEIAGKGADHVVLAHKLKYLRGRTLENIEGHLRAGLARAGVGDAAAYQTEVEGLEALLALALPGDVVGLMCHEQRAVVEQRLAELGATADDPRTIRRKVVAARGLHELEDEIAAIWALSDPLARVAAAAGLGKAHPGDPRIGYEWACAVDATGDRSAALELYHRAIDGGLREPYRHRAQLQAAAVYRDAHQPEIALQLLDAVIASHPMSSAAAALRGMVLLDAGHPNEAVADLVDALLDHATDEDAAAYRTTLHHVASHVRSEGQLHGADEHEL
ncbi:MAG TPA: tetratricopeptide repeat protein [Dermatophilaceae bacterium]|nr:tetratricopeptide repeat protein [Dermatophilaceae bacterium]